MLQVSSRQHRRTRAPLHSYGLAHAAAPPLSRRLLSGLRMMGLLGVQPEQAAPFAASDAPGCQMDIVVEGGQGLVSVSTGNAAADASKAALIDVTVTDPTGSSALAAACKTRCHAAEAGAKKKHKHYDKHVDTARYVLVPAAFEVFGAACTELHSFIDAVASWKTEHGSGTWRKSSILDWWRRRLSFALQAGTSIVVDEAMRRSRPNTGYRFYTTVALLHVPPPTAVQTTSAAATLVDVHVHSIAA